MEVIKVYTYNDDPIKSVLVKLTRADAELLKTANSHYLNPIGWFAMVRELINNLIDEAER